MWILSLEVRDKTMQLFVRVPWRNDRGGSCIRSITIIISPYNTIYELKSEIYEKLEVSQERIRLSNSRHPNLEDKYMLSYYDVQKDSTLHLDWKWIHDNS